MGNWLEFSSDSLEENGHFLVKTLNKFVSQLPEEETKVGLRLAIQILETADVASQETIGRAAGFTQSRSLRHYKQRLREEGLAGLFDRPRTGRPSITSRPQLQKMLSDIIWQALLNEQILPDDATLAAQLNKRLGESSSKIEPITASMVKSIRLRLGFQRVKIQKLFNLNSASREVDLPSFLPLPDQEQVPASSDKKQLPASPDQEQLPASPDQKQLPASPDQEQLPASSDQEQLPTSSDQEQLPTSSDQEQLPTSPDQKQLSAPLDLSSIEQKVPNCITSTVPNTLLASCAKGGLGTVDIIVTPCKLDDSRRCPEPAGLPIKQNLLPSPNDINSPVDVMIDILNAHLNESLPKSSVLREKQNQPDLQPSLTSTSCASTLKDNPYTVESAPRAKQPTQKRQKRYVAVNRKAEEGNEALKIGMTNVGGAFILLALLVQTSWLACASILPIPSNYAVTTTQWLLTAIFSVIFGIKRAFHLDDCLDIGFAIVRGRARPLSHSTFQHILRSFDEKSVEKFYQTTAKEEVLELEEGTHRISVDGHNLARYTQVVDLQKGKIGNSGRILPAEEMVLAFDLDEDSWLAMRTYHGTNKLSTALLDIIQELRQNKPHDDLRIFVDKGAYHGKSFQKLKELKNTHFYTPAKRTNPNIRQWEAISDQEYTSFVFDKHMKLAKDKRPTYRMADTKMEINVYEDKKKVGTVCLRALVVNNPDGQKPAEVWPFVLLTDDEGSDAKKLINEYGDHWAQEIGHRVGRHDLFLDVLPTGYKIKSKRNESGEIERQVEFDQSAFRLSAWLRLLVYNLMGRFASLLPANYQKMWAGTLLRKFIRRQAELYLLDSELLVVFDPFPDHEALHPLMVELNAKRIQIPWLNNLVLQFAIADKPIYPLKDPEKRKRRACLPAFTFFTPLVLFSLSKHYMIWITTLQKPN